MKYLICVLIVAFSAGVGKMLSKKYVVRDMFFKELLDFLNLLKSNISFKKMKVEEIYNNFFEGEPKFKNLFEEMKSSGQITNSKQFWFLKNEEKKTLESFLKTLGTGNDVTEMQNIENYISSLKDKIHDAEDNRKKNESIIYKVSLAVGAVICILIL